MLSLFPSRIVTQVPFEAFCQFKNIQAVIRFKQKHVWVGVVTSSDARRKISREVSIPE